MVTCDGAYQDQDTSKFSFTGLSTDQKPTVTYEGRSIANGSSFLEIDSKSVKFYLSDKYAVLYIQHE